MDNQIINTNNNTPTLAPTSEASTSNSSGLSNSDGIAIASIVFSGVFALVALWFAWKQLKVAIGDYFNKKKEEAIKSEERKTAIKSRGLGKSRGEDHSSEEDN